MGPVERSIRNHLAGYLGGRESLDRFTDWIVGAVWNIEQADEPAAATLGYAIELVLADWTSGLLDPAERDAGLHALVLAEPAATGGVHDL
ncbi:MAG: hypothetical protein QM692_16095 [Thermomicrobiales bacterium]